MAQDIYLNPETGDIDLNLGTTVTLCPTESELTRQRCLINLRMFRGEWFANILYGVPYFSRVYRKNSKAVTDNIFKSTIRNTEGVVSLESYESTLDPKTRKLTVSFSFKALDGVIINAEEAF